MKKSIFFFLLFIFSHSTLACDTCIDPEAKSGGNKKIDFIASSAIPFTKLMENSMHLMDTKMSDVQMKGSNEKIFLQMMLAHHEGAINMAYSIIAHSKDKTMINYARSIISSQYNEVLYMKTLLKSYK